MLATVILLAAKETLLPIGAWKQAYDPAGNLWLSAFEAALPLIVLLVALAVLRWRAHIAALVGLAICIVMAIVAYHMPVHLVTLSVLYGAAYGTFPIFWIIFPVIFLYRLTVRAGRFGMLQSCISGVTQDSRLQLLLIAFALGAFFEGAAGFGTPVAVCATLLVGLGFPPVEAAGFALLANTAPVAFGGLGIPAVALSGVTGLNLFSLTHVIAALLTPFCVLLPFWLICAFAGFRAMLEIWPAILITGGVFGTVQLFIALFHGPWLVDIGASTVTIAALMLLLKVWQPRHVLDAQARRLPPDAICAKRADMRQVRTALLPWIVLTASVTLWGIPAFGHWLDRVAAWNVIVPGLHNAVLRMPPVIVHPIPETAVYRFNPLSATGTGIFLAALIAAACMGIRPRGVLEVLWETVRLTSFTLVTIASLLALGFVSRYCGMDATLGLAFARTGGLYPFFSVLIGWAGTASTGSDTSSNVLFGSMQKLTAGQLGLSPLLLCAANSCGGVMGKMIAPQNIVVASTATESYGEDSRILRFVFMQSVGLVVLVGLLVLFAAHIPAVSRIFVH